MIMFTMRRKWVITLPLLLLAGFLFIVFLVSFFPGAGAALASPVRRVIGNENVARLETVVFAVQDAARQAQYGLGLTEPQAPWEISTEVPQQPAVSLPGPVAALPTITPSATLQPEAEEGGPAGNLTLLPSPTQLPPTPTTPPTSTPVPQWTLPAVPPFTDLEGEGVWLPYLTDPAGHVVAVRTFLLPDPERSYTQVGVVAFNLGQTELHYVLGSEEPSLPGGPRGTGRIPEQDLHPGRLLATFNGGFLATHGEYGAMAEGLVALPAKAGFGTITIGPSGEVDMGAWAGSIDPAGSYRAWRQNARMVIENGVLNERIDNGSILTWGGTINGEVVTWRSGLAVNARRDVLFYFAGPSMSMPALADAMLAVGATDGILLDINASWVHFAAIESQGNELVAIPLFPEGMETDADRYLRQSGRDFFYVTTRDMPAANNSSE